MHVVINRLPIKVDADWEKLAQKVNEFNTIAKGLSESFQSIGLVRTSPEAGVILVFFKSQDELVRVSRDIAAPWFAENIRPFLAGPVERTVGELVAGAVS